MALLDVTMLLHARMIIACWSWRANGNFATVQLKLTDTNQFFLSIRKKLVNLRTSHAIMRMKKM